MPERQSEFEDVLTLSEAASYLCVPEDVVLHHAEQRDIPSQQIGGEWRFLKRALAHWLAYGPGFVREFRHYPPWFLDHPMLEELLVALEKRLIQRIKSEKPERGSKEAVRKHVGVFKKEDDLDEVLATLSSIRATTRNEGGG